MKRRVIFIAALLACLAVSAGAETKPSPTSVTALEKRLRVEGEQANNPWVIIPHRVNYILPVTFVHHVNEGPFRAAGRDTNLSETEAKFQLSFKFPLGRKMVFNRGTLFFGYTQLSLWQVYNGEESSPIRETNYEPELFLSFKGETEFLGMIYRLANFGITHESNGREDGPLSRSWNRVYAQAMLDKGDFALSLKPWIRIPESNQDDQNPSIERYMGYGEMRMGYRFRGAVASVMLRNNLRSRNNKGALEIGVSFPVSVRVKMYVQYFTGYGETLLDYNVPVDRLGFGILLADWL